MEGLPAPVMYLMAWVMSHFLKLLGALLLTAVPTLYLYWRASIKRAINKKLEVRVRRIPEAERDPNRRQVAGPMLDYLELDTTFAKAEYPELALTSLGAYMASLEPQGAFSLQRALISIMDAYGLRVALPLALFAPSAWRNESPVVGAFQATPYGALLLTNSISTLALLSVSSISQRYSYDLRKQKMAEAQKVADLDGGGNIGRPQVPKAAATSLTPLQLMVLGSNPNKDGGISSRISSPFNLQRDLREAAGLGAHDSLAAVAAMPPAEVSEPSSAIFLLRLHTEARFAAVYNQVYF